jgi:peptidoglycan hydrolase-like protein with peptidoglycan-binding domain
MREFLKITAGGLIVALAVVPAMAQTGSQPQSEQQAPRNPSVTQPGGSSSDSSGTSTPTTKPDSTPKSMMRDSPGTIGTMSGDSDRGMRGHKAGKASVKQVQEALKAQGHDPGPIDGVMGPQTQEALRAYQRSQNLTETGRLDPETSEKLGVTGGVTPSQTR